tara:strand:+ start:1067 stop:1459 length:393 start_codon:yes stop_codon:yes gene_type:complete
MIKNLAIISTTFFVIGCASTGFIIDPKSSTNPSNYSADIVECEQLSKQEDYGKNIAMGSLMKGLATGIGSGALTALGIGSGAGLDIQTSVLLGLGAGGLGGAGLATFETYSARKEIIRNCMLGRGYTILK